MAYCNQAVCAASRNNLVPVLRDPAARIRDHAYHCFPRGGKMGRTNRYRLVEWNKPGTAADTADLELYDYQQDPEETRNLALQPSISRA